MKNEPERKFPEDIPFDEMAKMVAINLMKQEPPKSPKDKPLEDWLS
ncbi:MAG: hypothetical protein OXN84_16805 [Albidovulum sp.]|nr:hypothetical protein [Albidovulum sp.]